MRSWFCIVLLVLGCSPGGQSRGDAGGAGPRDTGPSMDFGPGVDANNPPTDTGGIAPRDVPPTIDAGCELMTPIESQIIGDPPDMLLAVDISGSMCTPLLDTFPAGDTKLKIMKDAINALVASKDARINFGLMLFPGEGTCGAGAVRVPVAERNAAPIMSTVSGLQDGLFNCAIRNSGATPTHISMDAAAAYFGTIPVNPIGRYVLLATDGLPNCGAPLPDGGTEETVEETITAITALQAAGINTYVLGFGTDITGGGDALRRMAVAGGTTTAYNARSAAELSTALDAIAAEIVPPSCTVELEGPVRDPALFQVSFDGGALIPRNTARTSGWDYDPATNTITFYGPECAQLQGGTVVGVDIDFGCPGPLI